MRPFEPYGVTDRAEIISQPSQLSLLLLTFNNSSYLTEALTSIEDNWLPYCDTVVVLNNGSTDDSQAQLEAWASKWCEAHSITLLRHEENLGPLGGLLHLLEHATTEWCAVLHGDDVLHSGFGIFASKSVEYASSKCFFLPTLRVFGPTISEPEFQTPPVMRGTKSIQSLLHVYGVFPVGGAVIPRRPSLRVLSPHKGNFLCAEDWLLFSGLANAGYHAESLRGVTYGYRIHSTNTTLSPLQAYSAGYVRGTLNRDSRRIFKSLSESQTVHEYFTLGASSSYVDGYRAGSGQVASLKGPSRPIALVQALPGLLLARILRVRAHLERHLRRRGEVH